MTSRGMAYGRAVAVWAGCWIAVASGYASEPRIAAPSFPVPEQSFTAAIQTGTGRYAKVAATGLYRVPAQAGAPYCVGRGLPVLFDGAVFVRGTDDFYTGETCLWSGRLVVQGEPGMIPAPVPQGFSGASPEFRGVFHSEQDGAFQHNALKECAPNWYFPKAFDIIGERKDDQGEKHPNPVKVAVAVPAPAADGDATLRIALNSNAAAGKDNALSVRLNGTPLMDGFSWKGSGYRIIEVDFDPSLLRDGENTVELSGDAVYIKYLDWVEIEANAAPRLRDGALTVQARANCPFSCPQARYAVDITQFGEEHAVEGREDVFALSAGHLYYFADRIAPPAFGPETAFSEPDLAGKDYVCIGRRDMLPALEPLIQRKTADGLHPACVALEDVMNVYNGGMYGPNGVEALLARAKPAYALLAAGFNRDCRDRLKHREKEPQWFPGIPAHLRQAEQLTVTDDGYTLDFTVKVGRVPVNSQEALAAWAAKAARYEPPDTLVLLTGQNTKVDFSGYQRQYAGKVPSSLIEADGRPPEEVRRDLFGLLQAGSRLAVYQGHAQSWELDKGLLDGSHAGTMPVSCWLLATCNGAYYHGDFEVYVRDWMGAPTGGCVNAIASASVGEDDQQDQVVRRFVENIDMHPEDDWGGMMRYLKKNLPLAEETMNDPNTPAFLKNSIAKDRKTIDAYSLLGDPALRVFASPRRAIAVKPPCDAPRRRVLSPGPVPVGVTFSGPWEAASFAADRFVIQGRAINDKAWVTVPLAEPLRREGNTFSFDSAALGLAGGVYEVRVAETCPGLPDTVWTVVRLLQESATPGVPVIRRWQGRPPASGDPEWIVYNARLKEPLADPKSVEYAFQIRDSARPDTLLEETAWQAVGQYKKRAADVPASFEIRARCRKHGAEGPWSEWTSMTLPPLPTGEVVPK